MEPQQSWGDARQSFLTDGYAILPNVFGPDEIARARDLIHQHLKENDAGIAAGVFGKTEPLVVLNIPALREFILDARILDAVRGLLNTKEPEFLLHCDAHWNDLGGWHKDTGETVCPDGYFGRPTFGYDECLVVKLAVYCEDHLDDDGGLHVQPRTHRTSEIESRAGVAISTRIGDVIAFDVRTTHMGARQSALQRTMNTVNKRLNSLNRRVPGYVRSYFGRLLTSADVKINHRTDRTALFFSFAAKGVESELTRMFASRNWERACRQANREFDIPPSLIEALSEFHVDVVSV